jgi:glycine/D-amino acid oxidase-like deaminating enzyme
MKVQEFTAEQTAHPGYDLCIVGGGIIGVLTAYQAAIAHPSIRIALIDRGEFGLGASHYAAALSSTLASTGLVGELSSESDRFYLHLARENPTLPIRQLPIIYVGDSSDPIPDTTRTITEVKPDDPRFSLPLSQLTNAHRLLYGGDVMHIEPLRLIKSLVRKLQAFANVTCLEYTGIESAQIMPDETLWLNTNRVFGINAERVLLALGPWSLSHQMTRSSVEVSCRNKKIVTMRLDVSPTANCPVIFFPKEDAFLLPTDEQFLFSIRSDEWDIQPDQKLLISDADRHNGRIILERYAPNLLDYYDDRDVFCDCYSSNSEPVIIPHNRFSKVFIATGGNGRGVRLAPAIARMALTKLIPTSNYIQNSY